MANTELVARLDAAIAEKNLLNHPFYQDWQAGKLSREELQLYASQYYRHVEAFPKHLRVLAARTEGPLARHGAWKISPRKKIPTAPHPKAVARFRRRGGRAGRRHHLLPGASRDAGGGGDFPRDLRRPSRG